ncbi:RDD family protein [Photobacterium sagamiensis]|uniref:RDD family protein n=1 Tax=Photobacterium sagamiensis TaxID=2910241 RepID=UPI003D12BE3B
MTEVNKEKRWIAGFWRRFGAFFIDISILGITGFCLGTAFQDFFVEIGNWGNLIGFSIALFYYGILNSNIGNGQTLGKKLFKIKVVDSENNTISIFKSCGRYLVLFIPAYFNGVQPDDDITPVILEYLYPLIIFGGLFSTYYLYIFNRITRQSLHDLALGTYVVNVSTEKQSVGKVWRPHLVIVSLFCIAMLSLPVFLPTSSQQELIAKLATSQDAIMEIPPVISVKVADGESFVKSTKGEDTETTFVAADVYLNKNYINDERLARHIAGLIIQNYELALEKDIIQIKLIYGYDTGIFSQWDKRTHTFEPLELTTDLLSKHGS